MQKPVVSDTASNQLIFGGGNLNELMRSNNWATPAVFDDLPFAVAVLIGPELVIEYANKFAIQFWQRSKEEVVGKKMFELFPQIRSSLEQVHRSVYEIGERCVAKESRIMSSVDDKFVEKWFTSIVDPIRDNRGNITGQLTIGIDVTEQVRARMVLEEKERSLQRLFAQAPAAIAVVSCPDLRYVMANNGYQKLFGRRPQDLIGRTIREVFPEIEGQWIYEVFEKVCLTGEAFTANEFPAYFTKDAEQNFQGYYDFVAEPIKNEEGKVETVMIHVLEVTDRVEARKKVEKSNEELRKAKEVVELTELRFQNLVRDATVGIIVLIGKEMRVEIVNEAYGRLIGLTPDDLLGKPLFSMIPQAEESYRPILESVLTTGVPITLQDSPYSVVTNGKKVEGFVSVVNQPYRDSGGTVLGVMEIVQDVTESVRSRKLLEESEERFRTLATNIPQIVWTSDSEGNVDYLSKQWQEYTGQSIEEGMSATHKAIHPDDNEKVLQWWQEAKTSGQSLRLDYRLKNIKTGEYRWFSVAVDSLRDKTGRIFKWIGTASDIHEKKKSADRLKELVAARTHELLQSNEDLQQFAHVASHDLKEPVRKIKTFGHRLLDEMQDRLDDRGKIYLNKILNASERMTVMIEGVLTYSTLNASLLQPKPVDLSSIVETIKTDLELLVSQTQTDIRYSDLPVVEGAEVLLYQLFYNLISNSIKFRSPDVSPVIQISSTTNSDNKSCQVIVKDNGIGFDPRFSDSIFDTFTRLNPKDQFEGTGLGLALCKKIVNRHEGKIEAISTPGKGAVFTIELPFKQLKNHI